MTEASMPVDLLRYVQHRAPDSEQAWREVYHARTFAFTADGTRCIVGGVVLCEDKGSPDATQCAVDEICAGLIARAVDERYGETVIEVEMQDGSTSSMSILDLGVTVDAVGVPRG